MSCIRSLINERLRRGVLLSEPAVSGAHLDEDGLNAFTEGRLTESESAPLIKHLIGCASCRHITAQLVRLDFAIGEYDTPTPSPLPASAADQRGHVRLLLEELSARVLPPSDGDAVFAYHAPAEDFEKNNEPTGAHRTSDDESDPVK